MTKQVSRLDQLKASWLEAREAYYNSPTGNAAMSDFEFDKLEKRIKGLDPYWLDAQGAGPMPTSKTKVDLPRYAPSLNKIYPEDHPAWAQSKNPTRAYIVTPKIDGTSILLEYNNGNPVGLYTRGNGKIGGNVNYILPMLSLPRDIAYKGRMFFRCEATMNHKVFAKKYAAEFANSRALVNGMFNRKASQLDPNIMKDVRLVVLGVYGERMHSGLMFAKQYGFDVVNILKCSGATIKDLANLEKILDTAWPFAVDGLVITAASAVFDYDSTSPPDWSIAFKKNDAPVQATVKKIIWQISRYGRWTPKIEIEPVEIDGTMVQHATAHNAKWVFDRKIGPGAVVELLKAGEIIPKIVGVLNPGRKQMPVGEAYFKGVHLYARAGENVETDNKAEIRATLQMLVGFGIENVAEASLAVLLAGSYKLDGIIKMSTNYRMRYLQEMLGTARGSAFANDLEKTFKHEGIQFADFLAYAPVVGEGFGRRLATDLEKAIPLSLLLEGSQAEVTQRIMAAKIPNFGPARRELLCKAIPKIRAMYKLYINAGAIIHVPKETLKVAKPKAGKYNGMICAWTGYRDKDQEQIIVDGGGEVGSLSKKTTHLFYNPEGKFMAKVDKARADGVTTLVWSDWFVRQ